MGVELCCSANRPPTHRAKEDQDGADESQAEESGGAVTIGRLGAAKRWGDRPKCVTCGRSLPLAKTGKAVAR
jgi:hypothetical protein